MTVVGTHSPGGAANSLQWTAPACYRRAPLRGDCRAGDTLPYPCAQRAALGRHLLKRCGSFARLPFRRRHRGFQLKVRQAVRQGSV